MYPTPRRSGWSGEDGEGWFVGSIGPLFEHFDTMLRDSGYIPVSGQIVAASLVAAPRQRNTKEEKAGIKAGKIPEA
ncbi:hypothetical protein ABFT80_04650 [Mesorhizobium sp. SB112]|uniref:hypothetical protein n=1 Tax=Mesorhizobium sp. SB112 TaxID=3151853 RepID=UPI003263BFBE